MTNDLISRQAAIDAIEKASDELYENIKKGATFPQRQWFDGMAQAQCILVYLPSVQKEIILCKDCVKFHKPSCLMAYDGREWADYMGFCHGGERDADGSD